MVIDSSDGLEESIGDCRAEKLEPTVAHVVRKGMGGRSGRWDTFWCSTFAISLIPANDGGEVVAKGSVLLLEYEEKPGIGDGRFDFEPVAYDPWVFQEPGYVTSGKPGHAHWVKSSESSSIGRPLLQYGTPRESGLGALEDEKFKEYPIIPGWHAPLDVVVLGHECVACFDPSAPFEYFWHRER